MTSQTFIDHYDKHYHLFLGYAIKLCSNKADALDLLQNASIKAYEHSLSNDNIDNFKSWMYIIIKNTYINRFSKIKRRRNLLAQAPGSTFDSFQGTTENEGESNLRISYIMEQISNINSIYSDPFLMKVKGYAYEEISKLLEIPMGTVKSRIHTAKKKLQVMIPLAHAA